MKILHTEASCGWGGQEIRILSEITGMMARGHQVTLLCPEEARIFSEARRQGISVYALPIGRKNIPGVFKLRRWLTENAVDVVNTHSSTDSWLAALACSTLAKAPPIVRTRHISAPIPKNITTRWLYMQAPRHIVTTGEKLRQQLIAENNFPAESITSVPTGIDTTWFSPPEAGEKAQARSLLNLPETAFLIGIVATLRSWKGHRYLIDAFAALHRAGHTHCKLVIVGDGPQREALEKQVAALGLADYVVFSGNQADVRPWMYSLDVFVLPSYANEGVPQALMQAMCCGLPCITTDVGSICELAVHGETALLADKESVDSLTDRLICLLQDSDLRAALGSAAHAHCSRHCAREAMLDRMEHIFHQVATLSDSRRH